MMRRVTHVPKPDEKCGSPHPQCVKYSLGCALCCTARNVTSVRADPEARVPGRRQRRIPRACGHGAGCPTVLATPAAVGPQLAILAGARPWLGGCLSLAGIPQHGFSQAAQSLLHRLTSPKPWLGLPVRHRRFQTVIPLPRQRTDGLRLTMPHNASATATPCVSRCS